MDFNVDAKVLPVKDGREAIAVIVHDDGDEPTARYLADEFSKYDLCGTIAMVSCKLFSENESGERVKNEEAVSFWQSILDTGRFSMSSHTRTHVYWGRHDRGDSGTYWWIKGNPDTVREYSTEPGRITSEVRGSYEDLRKCFPSERVLSFVKAGFGVNTDGTQITEDAFDIIKRHYITMRNTGGGVETIPAQNPYSIKSYLVENADNGEKLISFTDSAISSGGMIVYLFHQIKDALKDAASELFQYVSARQNEGKVWCATFEEASLYTEEYRTATVKASASEDKIELALESHRDPNIYNYPLTVRVNLPKNWHSAVLNIGGVSTLLETLEDESGAFVLANIIPGTSVAYIQKGI